MPDDKDPLKPLHEASFVEGQRAVANDVTAQRIKEIAKSLGQVGDVVAETLDQADRIAQDGDPHKQKLAALMKEGLLGAVSQMTTGRPPAEEAREAAQATPLLSKNSEPSATSLPSSPPKPKKLEHRPPEPPEQKRGRGRPRKKPQG